MMMMPGAAGQARAELFGTLRGFPTTDPALLVRTTLDLLLRALSDRWGMASADAERAIVGEARGLVADLLADDARREREAREAAERQRQREEQRQAERRREAEDAAFLRAEWDKAREIVEARRRAEAPATNVVNLGAHRA